MCGVIPPCLEVGTAIRLDGGMLYCLDWRGGWLYRPWLKLGAALYTEGTEGGGEDGDEEIDDGFPIRLFHVHFFLFNV